MVAGGSRPRLWRAVNSGVALLPTALLWPGVRLVRCTKGDHLMIEQLHFMFELKRGDGVCHRTVQEGRGYVGVNLGG